MKRLLAALSAAIVLLSGCSSSNANPETTTIEISNGYVRATDMMSEMGGMLMTGAFMEITNNTDEDVTLEGGSSAIAQRLEVHEVVDGVMRQKEGGLLIAAGQTQSLKPGGNHVMLIGLDGQLVAGDEVTFTLEFSNGDSVEVTMPVKVVNLEQEHYDSTSPSPSMDMNE